MWQNLLIWWNNFFELCLNRRPVKHMLKKVDFMKLNFFKSLFKKPLSTIQFKSNYSIKSISCGSNFTILSTQSQASFKRICQEDLKFVNDFTRLKIKAQQCRDLNETFNSEVMTSSNKDLDKRREVKTLSHLKLENGFTFHLK